MTDIDTLLSEINTAGAERERKLISDALFLAHKRGWFAMDDYRLACAQWGCAAYLSAAEALVGDEFEWSRHRGANGRMTMQVDGDGPIGCQAQAATPAMTLTSAALQAHKAKEQDDDC